MEATILDLRKSSQDLASEYQLRVNELRTQLDYATRQLSTATGDAGGAYALLTTDLQAARAGRDAAVDECDRLKKDHIEEMARLRSDLETMARRQAEANKTALSAEKEKEEVRTANLGMTADLQRHRETRSSLEHRVLALLTEKENAERERRTAIDDLARHQPVMSTMAELRSEIVGLRRARTADVEKAEKALQAEHQRYNSLRKELELAQGKSISAEGEMSSLWKALQKAEEHSLEVSAERSRMQASLDQQTREFASLKQRLEIEKGAREMAERIAQQTDYTLRRIEGELVASRKAVVRLEQDLTAATKMSAAQQERADRQAKELADLSSVKTIATSISSTITSKSRHSASSSVPSVQSASVLENLRTQALTTAVTGVDGHSPSMMGTKETEEITRLGRIIEAQKAIIEDQKSKILYWAQVSAHVFPTYRDF